MHPIINLEKKKEKRKEKEKRSTRPPQIFRLRKSARRCPLKFPWFRRGWNEFAGRRKTRAGGSKLFDSRGREARTIVADDNHLVVPTTRRSDFRGEKRGWIRSTWRKLRAEAAKHPGTSWAQVRLSLDANEREPRTELSRRFAEKREKL